MSPNAISTPGDNPSFVSSDPSFVSSIGDSISAHWREIIMVAALALAFFSTGMCFYHEMHLCTHSFTLLSVALMFGFSFAHTCSSQDGSETTVSPLKQVTNQLAEMIGYVAHKNNLSKSQSGLQRLRADQKNPYE